MSGSSVSVPKLNTKTSVGTPTTAPAVKLVTASTTQVPVMIEHVLNQTVGEEPLYLVRMRDNTLVYVKESLLTQNGGIVMF
jgi:hypothetical protein